MDVCIGADDFSARYISRIHHGEKRNNQAEIKKLMIPDPQLTENEKDDSKRKRMH